MPQIPSLLRQAALVLLLLSWSGCSSSPKHATVSTPGRGLSEYLELVDHSQAAVQTMLHSLDTFSQQNPPVPSKVVSAFSDEVDRLEAGSVQIRARAQAMQARGDAYFANWEENMAAISDPAVRASAERHRAELQQTFAEMEGTLQETRDSFRLFLAGLRQLRITAESNPATLPAPATRHLIRETQQHGKKVQEGLNKVRADVNKMQQLVTSTTPVGSR